MRIRLVVRRIGKSLGLMLLAQAVRNLRVKERVRLRPTGAPGIGYRIVPCDPDFANVMEIAESFMRRYRGALQQLAK